MRRRNLARRTRVRAWPALSAVWWAERCADPVPPDTRPADDDAAGAEQDAEDAAAVRRHHYAVDGQPVGPSTGWTITGPAHIPGRGRPGPPVLSQASAWCRVARPGSSTTRWTDAAGVSGYRPGPGRCVVSQYVVGSW